MLSVVKATWSMRSVALGSGAVLYLNRAAEEVTGYARDGLAGKPLVQIVPESFRATLERQIGRAIAGEAMDNFDLELVTTSGDRIRASPISTPNSVPACISTRDPRGFRPRTARSSATRAVSASSSKPSSI